MILGIQAQLPSDPTYYPLINDAINKYKCLLNETHSDKGVSDNTVGKFKSLSANQVDPIDVGMVDPFSEGAKDFYNQALTSLAKLTGGFDGLVLRGNSPFFYSNGTNLTASKTDDI